MPKILPSDTQESYVSKCIPYVMKNEGLNKDQASGKCFGLWKNHLKNKRSKAQAIVEDMATELLKSTVDYFDNADNEQKKKDKKDKKEEDDKKKE